MLGRLTDGSQNDLLGDSLVGSLADLFGSSPVVLSTDHTGH